jgi:predicted DNA-binding transcriptional regulator AlpA
MNEIISVAEVLSKTGISRTTLHRLRCKGQFPNSVRISERRIGFFLSDVRNWLEGQRSL